jgi:hypothetical protein
MRLRVTARVLRATYMGTSRGDELLRPTLELCGVLRPTLELCGVCCVLHWNSAVSC